MKETVSRILQKIGLQKPVSKVWMFFKRNILKARTSIAPHVRILLYHRIADVDTDPYQLSVSPANFLAQLQALQSHGYSVLPLVTCIEFAKQGTLPKKCIAITFDDGFADNFHSALPILTKLNMPATIFVTAGKIDDPTPFESEEKTRVEDRGRAMTSSELELCAKSPLVEIGAHTMSHPRLATIAVTAQEYEITESKKRLEQLIGKPVVGFAYPYGGEKDFTTETLQIVEKAGFQYAAAATKGKMIQRSPRFALPRILVRNWDAEQFLEELHRF